MDVQSARNALADSAPGRRAWRVNEEPWARVLQERGSGERALLCAVLGDAVRCLTRTIGGREEDQVRLAIQARRWIMKRGEDWPYSFDNVCVALGLHPRLVRRRLLVLAREIERGPHPL